METLTQELPSEYFIRKRELIKLVYNYTDGEIINEIMNGAPTYWTTVLTPHLYHEVEDFQIAIKFHEDNLMRMDSRTVRFDSNPAQRENYFPTKPFQNFRNARTNLVGWSKNASTPEFPKDDTNKHAELIQVLVEAQSPRTIPLSATAKSKVDISYNPSLGLINVEVRASSLGNAALRMVVEQTPEHANTAREWIHGRRDSKCARYVDNPSGAPCIASDKGA